MPHVTLLIGTAKGGFLATSADRVNWTVDGPFFKGWKVTTAARIGGRFIVGTASDVYGPALHTSDDLENWTQVQRGPAWPEGSDRALKQIWCIADGGDRLWAGVDDAGLFSSVDGGATWDPVDALNEHETRSGWFPGAGGMCAHSILVDPKDTDRIWCGISAVGLFRSDDGGGTWEPRNEGIPVVIEDKVHKCIGCCVHGLVADPDDADTIYRREHVGVFRSRDGGDTWERIENGLSSWFGFPIAMDKSTRSLYLVPLESDEYRLPVDGRFQVFRSRDNGDSWHALTDGLPQSQAWMGSLRGAMDVDHMDPCGVYVGTTTGDVFVSADNGDHWKSLPCALPRVLWVSAFIDP